MHIEQTKPAVSYYLSTNETPQTLFAKEQQGRFLIGNIRMCSYFLLGETRGFFWVEWEDFIPSSTATLELTEIPNGPEYLAVNVIHLCRKNYRIPAGSYYPMGPELHELNSYNKAQLPPYRLISEIVEGGYTLSFQERIDKVYPVFVKRWEHTVPNQLRIKTLEDSLQKECQNITESIITRLPMPFGPECFKNILFEQIRYLKL